MAQHNWQVKYSNKDDATFEMYLADLDYIFETTDMPRDVPDLFLNVVKYSSHTAEAVRRNQPDQLIIALSDVMIWLLGFVGKLNKPTIARDQVFRWTTTLSKAIWQKYPNRCPVCFGGAFDLPVVKNSLKSLTTQADLRETSDIFLLRQVREASAGETMNSIVAELRKFSSDSDFVRCRCMASPIAGTEDRTGAGSTEEERRSKLAYDYVQKLVRRQYSAEVGLPRSWGLSKWEDMFSAMFGDNGKRAHIEDVVNHLQEEVGEIASALVSIYTYHPRNDPEPTQAEILIRQEELAEEIADVVSWVFSGLMKAKESFQAVQRYRAAFGFDMSMSLENPHIADIIWAKWGEKNIGNTGHLRCRECWSPGKCTCHPKILRTDD